MEPRPLPELIADFQNTIDGKGVNKTIMACAEKAREKGFKFFGIQYYTECWSGTGAEKTYGRDGTSKGCQNGVGKSAANFVYRFGDYGECETLLSVIFNFKDRLHFQTPLTIFSFLAATINFVRAREQNNFCLSAASPSSSR